MFHVIIQVKFTMEVTEELTWSLQIGQQRVESRSKHLGALPQVLTSLSNVRHSVEGLESLHFCTGNEDSKYFAVQAARKGVFKDPTGACYLPVYYKFVIVIFTHRINGNSNLHKGSFQLWDYSLFVL